jgi:hypothetical protein
MFQISTLSLSLSLCLSLSLSLSLSTHDASAMADIILFKTEKNFSKSVGTSKHY